MAIEETGTPSGPLSATEHLERAVCFRCNQVGNALVRLPPFTLVECPDCSQRFVSPRLDDEGRTKLYGNVAYFEDGVYANRFANWLQKTWIRGRLDYARSQSPHGTRLLEIGCAYGMFLAEAEHRGYEVRGLEYSEAAAAKASETLGVEIVTGEISDLDDSYRSDVLVAWDVIEHVADPSRFAAKAFSLLNGDGVLLLSCPNAGSLAARVLGRRWWNLKLDRHIWQFEIDDLRWVLTDAGFMDVDIHINPLRSSNFGRVDSMFASARRPAEA